MTTVQNQQLAETRILLPTFHKAITGIYIHPNYPSI